MRLNLQRFFNVTEMMNVVKRDWPSVLSALIAFGLTVVSIWRHKLQIEVSDDVLLIWIGSACLGISLFLSARLGSRSGFERLVFSGVALVSVMGFAFWHQNQNEIRVFRFIHFLLISHLLVAITPMRERQDQTGEVTDRQLWNFNWYLLSRLTFGVIFCGILTLGLLGALGAVELLFGVDIKDTSYATVSAFTLIVVSVFQILSTMANTKVSPQGEQITGDLRRLIQFLFTPLTVIYFLIAYAYIAKITIQFDWPKGKVGLLVSLLTILVLLTYVLQKPLREVQAFPEWMRRLWRWNFALLILPLVVLQLAIWRRVSDYGVTENRAVILYLSLWALAISIYNIDPFKRRMWVIPVSLVILLIVTLAGPLSPHSLAYQSQKNQLAKLLERTGQSGPDGHLVWDPAKGTDADSRQIKNILTHLCKSISAQAMFKAAGLNPLPERNNRPYFECWEGFNRDSYMSRAVDQLKLPTGDSMRKGKVTYRVSDDENYAFNAGETEFAILDFGYLNTKKATPKGGGKLRFEYSCCAPVLTWTPDKQRIDVDLLPALKDPKTPLVIKGGGGYLTLWVNAAMAYGEDVHLGMSDHLKFSAVFSTNPNGATRLNRDSN